MNEREPNSNFFLFGDYNLNSSVTWIRRSESDCVCAATDLEGEIAHAIVDMQSLTNLEQFNYVEIAMVGHWI